MVDGALLLVGAVVAFRQIVAQQEAARIVQNEETSRREATAALALLPFNRSEAAARIDKPLQTSETPDAIDAGNQLSLLRGAIDAKFDLTSVTHVGFLQSGALAARGTGGTVGSAVYIRCNRDADNGWRYRPAFTLTGKDDSPLGMLSSSPDGRAIVAAQGQSVYAWTFDTPERQDCGGVPIVRMPPATAADSIARR